MAFLISCNCKFLQDQNSVTSYFKLYIAQFDLLHIIKNAVAKCSCLFKMMGVTYMYHGEVLG